MDQLERFWDAVEAFWDRLSAVHPGALALALGFHVLNLALRAVGWRTILRAAYPGARVRWRSAFGAYVAGVGINGVVPARAGDVVKLLLIHRRVEGSTYPALASGLVVETLFDLPVALVLVGWAWWSGVVPHFSLPDLPAFDLSWMADHPLATGIAVILLIGAVAAAVVVYGGHARAFWDRVGQGVAVLRTPRRYLAGVALPQALGWCCRLASAYCFLAAFGLAATWSGALLVLAVGAVATAMPLTPGGLGPKQALLVVVLAGQAGAGAVLAFSVGMEAAVLVTNLVLGLSAMAVMLGGLRFRKAIAEARAEQARTGRPVG